MWSFVKRSKTEVKCELLLDLNIYSKDIILKTAYVFLDRAYFLFKQEDNNIIVFIESKWENIDNILNDFSDELLATYLRDKLEKDNKVIRETIIDRAIGASLDVANFVKEKKDSWSRDNDINNDIDNDQVDFDKDINEILKEIENDPELKVDEDEIEKILKEIEEESDDDKDLNNNKCNSCWLC